MEELNGVIENIVFRNDENGYSVAEARVEGGVQMTLELEDAVERLQRQEQEGPAAGEVQPAQAQGEDGENP